MGPDSQSLEHQSMLYHLTILSTQPLAAGRGLFALRPWGSSGEGGARRACWRDSALAHLRAFLLVWLLKPLMGPRNRVWLGPGEKDHRDGA